ncbi:MAG: hypothetical protein HY059_22420 [Proteobacteria bacterium]|nr:hypothetical protein [Pseudomonadota bacterium]
MGLSARFVIGDDHSWIIFKVDDQWRLLEAARKEPDYVPALAAEAEDYEPKVSVTARS